MAIFSNPTHDFSSAISIIFYNQLFCFRYQQFYLKIV